MQVTVETTSGLERKMRVVIPAERIEVQVDQKLKQTAQQARINGFRPGKVPVREIKRRFGPGIRQEVSSEVIQSSYGEALQQEDINPAGMPSIEEVKIEEGQDLEYTAVFEVFPEVELGAFDTVNVTKLVAEVTDEDLDKMIETLREQRIEYVETDRASAEKDKVNMDFEGFLDGEAFEGGKAEGADIVIGSGSMIPGFEDGLVGLKAGDEKDLEITFPEQYQAENLAGKDAVFKIKVNTVSEPTLPELNEEFFEVFDVKEGGLEAFREEVKSNMRRELDAATKAKVKDQVMDGLLAVSSLELPKALVDQEIDKMRREAVQQFGGENAQIDPSMLPAEMFSEQAEKRVELGLIASTVIEKHEIKPDEDRVRTTIEELAASYENPEQVVNFYYSNEQQLSQVQGLVLEDQMVDLVLASASVEEKSVPYDEAVQREAPAPADEDEQAAEADADSAEAAADEADSATEGKSE